jgi:hypothetical protein
MVCKPSMEAAFHCSLLFQLGGRHALRPLNVACLHLGLLALHFSLQSLDERFVLGIRLERIIQLTLCLIQLLTLQYETPHFFRIAALVVGCFQPVEKSSDFLPLLLLLSAVTAICFRRLRSASVHGNSSCATE